MNELEHARTEIDRVDREIAKLFEERMLQAKRVAAYKKEHGLPIEDKSREAAMLTAEGELVSSEIRPYFCAVMRSLIAESKKYQHCLFDGAKAAYSGVRGAFAHVAATKIFDGAETVPCSDFDSAYRSVEEGLCDFAVLPIENSYAGDVDRVLDLSYHGTLSVSGIYDMPLTQCLIAKPGVTLKDITEVVSHPQALSQCKPYLEKKGWRVTKAVNTAVAAKSVSEGERRDIAVIASAESAELYGLSLMERGINENKNNTTRFAVFTRTEAEPKESDGRFVILFTTKNTPGALASAISMIGEAGYNMRCLKSRPTGDENWAYYFYIEAEGSLAGAPGEIMMKKLATVCRDVRLLGSFKGETLLSEKRG